MNKIYPLIKNCLPVVFLLSISLSAYSAGLTVSDYEAMGFKGVTEINLVEVNQATSKLWSDSEGIVTDQKIQEIICKVSNQCTNKLVSTPNVVTVNNEAKVEEKITSEISSEQPVSSNQFTAFLGIGAGLSNFSMDGVNEDVKKARMIKVFVAKEFNSNWFGELSFHNLAISSTERFTGFYSFDETKSAEKTIDYQSVNLFAGYYFDTTLVKPYFKLGVSQLRQKTEAYGIKLTSDNITAGTFAAGVMYHNIPSLWFGRLELAANTEETYYGSFDIGVRF